jgi:hypothetical protein
MGIEISTLILASASIPVVVYGSWLFISVDKIDGGFNILGGVYTFLAVLSLPLGFPGMLIFPVTAGISSLGSFFSHAKNPASGKVVKGVVMAIIAVSILLMQVIL